MMNANRFQIASGILLLASATALVPLGIACSRNACLNVNGHAEGWVSIALVAGLVVAALGSLLPMPSRLRYWGGLGILCVLAGVSFALCGMVVGSRFSAADIGPVTLRYFVEDAYPSPALVLAALSVMVAALGLVVRTGVGRIPTIIAICVLAAAAAVGGLLLAQADSGSFRTGLAADFVRAE